MLLIPWECLWQGFIQPPLGCIQPPKWNCARWNYFILASGSAAPHPLQSLAVIYYPCIKRLDKSLVYDTNMASCYTMADWTMWTVVYAFMGNITLLNCSKCHLHLRNAAYACQLFCIRPSIAYNLNQEDLLSSRGYCHRRNAFVVGCSGYVVGGLSSELLWEGLLSLSREPLSEPLFLH